MTDSYIITITLNDKKPQYFCLNMFREHNSISEMFSDALRLKFYN